MIGKAKIIEVIATKLDPGSTYIIAVDKQMMSLETAISLRDACTAKGIEGVFAMFDGDPTKGLQIIEQPKEKK